MAGILEIAEKLLDKEVTIVTGKPGLKPQKTFEGRLVEFNNDKAIIEKKGSGERTEINVYSIYSIME